MKKIFNQAALIIIGTILVGTMFSCQEDTTTKDMILDDVQLIEEIQKSGEKIEITSTELPATSVNVLKEEYYDCYTDKTYFAPELGYEVAMRKGKGSLAGELAQVYFNVEGRELSAEKAYGNKSKYKNKKRHDCFDLVLPVSFTMPDGSVLIIEVETDWEAIKEWFDANPESKERPLLQFPVEIVFEDGTLLTVNSDEEMKAVHETCIEGDIERFKRKCFDFVYPVTHIMPDGTEIVIEDKDDRDAIKAWYEANPEVEEKPALKFPVDVVLRDETTLTINNEEEMEAIYEQCGTIYSEHLKRKCFDFVYPVTHIMPDGTEIVIEDKEDRDAIKAWYEANPEVEEKPALKFPIDIIFRDGETITVNNEEEFVAIREQCKDMHIIGKYTKNIVNPIVYIDDCEYPVSGTIEYLLEGEVVAIVDYGDGTCDNIATKTVDGETFEFEIKKKGEGKKKEKGKEKSKDKDKDKGKGKQ